VWADRSCCSCWTSSGDRLGADKVGVATAVEEQWSAMKIAQNPEQKRRQAVGAMNDWQRRPGLLAALGSGGASATP
jgi:hypothetical protein